MSSSLSLAGAYTALVTPFAPGGESIDHPALEALVERQIQGGIAGLVPCGTTGEAPTLTEAEQLDVITTVVHAAKKRIPVIAGTGSFSTKKTIEASRNALKAGADAVMVVMPYYSKPTQDGLFEHIVTIARAVEAPVILYNIPGRSSIDLLAETTERICAAAPNVVATKEATGNVLRCQDLKMRLGDRLTVLSGDDTLTLAMMAVGAVGVISVTTNVYPAEVSAIVKLALEGKFSEAQRLHFRMLKVHEAMFIESNPSPVKGVAELLGHMKRDVRLPLVAASEAAMTTLAGVVKRFSVNG